MDAIRIVLILFLCEFLALENAIFLRNINETEMSMNLDSKNPCTLNIILLRLWFLPSKFFHMISCIMITMNNLPSIYSPKSKLGYRIQDQNIDLISVRNFSAHHKSFDYIGIPMSYSCMSTIMNR